MKSAAEGYSLSLEGKVLQSRFRIAKRVSRGGMAWLFKALDLQDNTPVAVKVLFPHHAEEEVLRGRFIKEFELQYSLKHPNIAQVIALVEEGELLGTVMEWVEGEDLKQAIRRHGGPFPLREVLDLSLPLLGALGYAHSNGMVHRDIKPANILLSWEKGYPIPKLTDFGIAKLLEESEGTAMTSTGSALGTMRYMSPEQIRDSKNVDHRADIYSFGVVLYQMATGQAPFSGSTENMMFQQLYEDPKPPTELCPSLPAELEQAILRCLQKKPEDRFESCPVLSMALQNAIPEALLDDSETVTMDYEPGPSEESINRPLTSPHQQNGSPEQIAQAAHLPSGILENKGELSEEDSHSNSASFSERLGSALPPVPDMSGRQGQLQTSSHMALDNRPAPSLAEKLRSLPGSATPPTLQQIPVSGHDPQMAGTIEMQLPESTSDTISPYADGHSSSSFPSGSQSRPSIPPQQVYQATHSDSGALPPRSPHPFPNMPTSGRFPDVEDEKEKLPLPKHTDKFIPVLIGLAGVCVVALVFLLFSLFRGDGKLPLTELPRMRDAGSIAMPEFTIRPQEIDGNSTCQTGQRACYFGPKGTNGIGRCRAGVQFCNNGKWGPCYKERRPSRESCNGLDDDCDGKVDNLSYTGKSCTRRIGGCRYRGVYQCDSKRRKLFCQLNRALSLPGIRRVTIRVLRPRNKRVRVRYGGRSQSFRRSTCIEVRRSVRRVSIQSRGYSLCVFPIAYRRRKLYIRLKREDVIEPPANYCLKR